MAGEEMVIKRAVRALPRSVLQPEAVGLDGLLAEVFEMIRAHRPDRRQVLLNLSNAVKFVEHGRVTLKLRGRALAVALSPVAGRRRSRWSQLTCGSANTARRASCK